ncbi:MAG: hypothetical protein B9S32_17365 [Verrucomicrobia bacterium Tous-C9LFEB]|nr:MAG: hypothetical protein B9S32_17365 [Verrucomicrobia bacterium Tous-C9LFEB]
MKTLTIEHPFTLPADDWFHIAPLGEFEHASGVRQVIDDAACDAMVSNFGKDAATPNFPGLLVDFDHFSHSSDKTSAAAGWITALRAESVPSEISNLKSEGKASGLWAQIRWSDLGETAVRGGRYRLVSPVWNRSDCEVVNGEENKVRPLRLSRVALTNDPNLKGLVPLTNRTEAKEETMDYKSKLLELLGLKAEATDEQIVTAVEAQLAEAQNLQQRYAALLAERVEDDLLEFTAVVGDVETVRSQLLANREGTLTTLRALRQPVALPVAAEPKPVLHNRAQSRVPETIFSAEKSPAEEARARRIANRTRELQKQLGLGHTQAFQMARGEIEKAA